MTNDAIGGDGMPSPPKASEVDEPPGKGACDGNFSDQNPPGIGGEPSLGSSKRSNECAYFSAGTLLARRERKRREERFYIQ
jgi:hypothetical protein